MQQTEKYESYIIDRKEHRTRYREFLLKHGAVIKEIQKMPLENKISWGTMLEKNARLYPDNLAVLFEDTRLTYKEFNEIVNQYANYFISLGLKKGDVVEVVMKNRTEFLIIYCANAKIGAISSLINTEQRRKSLIHSINLTPGKFIIVGEECWDVFKDVIPDIDISKAEKLFFVFDQGEMSLPDGFENLPEIVKGSSVDNPPTVVDVHTRDPIAYIFTSGTTGLPKAAILVHFRTAVYGHYFGILAAEYTPNDIMYICIPFFHGTALETCWSAVMASGAAVAIGRKFSASGFWDEIKRYNATAFGYVGEICRYLLNQPPSPDDANNTVKTVIGNGLRPEIWMEFKKRFDIHRVVEFYGASEGNAGFLNLLNFDYTCGSTAAVYAIVEYDIENNKPILDENGYMKKVDVGGTGLLLIKSHGAFTFEGYTDRDETEKKIFRNVFKEGDAWFNTGDLMFEQGCNHVMFVDRLGDTFRWKGHNVATTEVEGLINLFDHVLLSCVYGIKIPQTDGRAGMAALVIDTDASNFDLRALADTFRENLPSYAIPLFIRFKSMLSITPTFKLKKEQLKREGFELDKIEDKLYVMLPGESEYKPLTNEIYQDILNMKYQF